MELDFPYLYYYMVFAFGILFLALVFIPKAEFKKLFWFGFLWGSGADFVFESGYVFFHITKYQHMGPFHFGVLSIWTVLAWTPTLMLFAYTLPQRKEKIYSWVNLLIWSASVAGVAYILEQLDLLVFIRLGPWFWFVPGFTFLYIAARHYRYLQASCQD